MKQIICLSHSPWHANPSRTYQLLSRFKNGRIIFFDPPLSGNGEHHWRDEGQQVAKNVTLHGSPPKGKTAESRRFFNKAYQKRLASHVAAVMRDYAFDKPLLWLTEPYSADFVGKMSHGAVIYDYQELACAETTRKDALRAALAAELLRKADVVIGQTKSACDTLRAANECAVLVPNGVDYALFSRAASANLA
ncbi:MAG: hypothetical protein LBI44_03335, partial [Oscillospiraceae bacterium]|nr:hypothetical protein [Oscillospiraceae bacterium]